MNGLLNHLDTLVQLAGFSMLLAFLFVRLIIRSKTVPFGETLSFIITVIMGATLFMVLLFALVIALFNGYPIEHVRKTGKSISILEMFFPQEPIPSAPENKVNKDFPQEPIPPASANTANKVFPQKIIQSVVDPLAFENYAVHKGLEEGESFYDNHCGLEFTIAEINPENNTAQLSIGSTNVPADSLSTLQTGGINYRHAGKTHLIYLSDINQENGKKFITLNIIQ